MYNEDVRLEQALSFSFSDPIIPLVLLLEITCWIGPDWKTCDPLLIFRSGN